MVEALARADKIERAARHWSSAICAGFTRANIRDVGPSVTVTGDGDDPRLQAIAEGADGFRLGDARLRQRDAAGRSPKRWRSPSRAGRATSRWSSPTTPTNPGGGGYGDATAFLKGLIEADVKGVAFHAICDPEAVREALKNGLGKQRLTIGGKIDPALAADR